MGKEVRREVGAEMGKELGKEVEKQEGGGEERRREEEEEGGGPGRSWKELRGAGGTENITINFILQNVQFVLFSIQ